MNPPFHSESGEHASKAQVAAALPSGAKLALRNYIACQLLRWRNPWIWGSALVFCAAYLALDRATVDFQMWSDISAWYPPSGLAEGALIGLGLFFWPVVLLTEIAASILNYHQSPESFSFWISNIAILVGYGGAAAFLRSRKLDMCLRTFRDGIAYVLTALAAALFVALLGTAGLMSDHKLPSGRYWEASVNWWIGDAVALMCITPFLLVYVLPWVRQGAQRFHPSRESVDLRDGHIQRGAGARATPPGESRSRYGRAELRTFIETLCQALSVVAALWFVFRWSDPRGDELSYILFLPVIWIAVRRGVRGAAAALLLLNLAATAILWWEPGRLHNLPVLQGLVLVVSLTGICLGTLVTERFEAQHKAIESEERYRAVLGAMREGILLQNAQGQITAWNASAERIFGLAPDHVLGTLSAVLLRGAVREDGTPFPETEAPVGFTLRTGEPLANVIMGLQKSPDQTRWISVNSEPLFSPGEKKPHAVVCTFADVTARKQADDDLRRAKNTAEEALRVKSQFLANMSHELRTPMNGILGMTDVVLETSLTPEQHEYLRMVRTSADDLLALVNELLDFSKMEAGRLDLDLAEMALPEQLESALRVMQFRARDKGLNLEWFIEPDVPSSVLGDSLRLKQILINLVGNAVKFTSAGLIAVAVNVQSQDENSVVLHFMIRDTGIGIPEEKQQLIFDAFTQADSSTTRQYGGTGLGLTISKGLVEMMGGTIWVESELGVGTAFHFTAKFGLLAPLSEAVPPPRHGQEIAK